MTCKCMRLAEAMKLAFADRTIPRCPEHEPEPAAPLALNDDDGLAAAISQAMGIPVNRTTNL